MATAKRVLVPVANGTEEIEAICVIDVLRRAGAEVVVASVEAEKLVTCARQTKVQADVLIVDVQDQTFDLIACPGGMPGAERLRDSATLTTMLKKQAASNNFYGAICASPAVVLASHGLLDGKEATCYPAPPFTSALPKYLEGPSVVVSGNCITSRGPGTSLDWSIKCIEVLYGPEEASKVAKGLLMPAL